MSAPTPLRQLTLRPLSPCSPRFGKQGASTALSCFSQSTACGWSAPDKPTVHGLLTRPCAYSNPGSLVLTMIREEEVQIKICSALSLLRVCWSCYEFAVTSLLQFLEMQNEYPSIPVKAHDPPGAPDNGPIQSTWTAAGLLCKRSMADFRLRYFH